MLDIYNERQLLFINLANKSNQNNLTKPNIKILQNN